MSDRDEILEEIRRCAAENGGSPLGRNAFVKATGIRPASIDKHWLRWSEAVVEAGFSPGVMNAAYSDVYVLETLALLVRELGHYPIANELRRKARETVGFPSRNTFDRFGGKAASMHRLAGFCRAHPEFADVLLLVGDVDDEREPPAQPTTAVVGYVYLAKSGRHYKIGQTHDLVRRTNELRIQLPERLSLVHQISTDDPAGIERYWHQRFSHLRANGEWFALGAAEVAVFKRRKSM